MSGPGLLFVNSKITKPDLLSEDVFLKWYSDEHIEEVVETSGIKAAARYVDLDKKAERPYLALYPVKDLAFLETNEFNNINSSSKLLPGSGVIYDMADFDIRYYQRAWDFEPEGIKPGPAKCLLAAQVTPEDGQEADYDAWYREEHIPMLSTCDGYIRSTKYELTVQRQNALNEKDTLPPRPKFLTLHEWDTTDINWAQLSKTMETEWAKKVTAYSETTVAPFYSLAQVFGHGPWHW